MRRQLTRLLLIFFLAASMLSAVGCGTVDTTGKNYNYIVMGELTLWAKIYGKDRDAAFLAMRKAVEEVDAGVNVNGSYPGAKPPLAQLNEAGANTEIQLDYHAYTMLTRAKEYYTASDRKFNPAIYPLLKLWKLDPLSLALKEEFPLVNEPDYSLIQSTMAHADMDKLILSEKNGKYYAEKLDADLMFDLGSQAKGYATDYAISKLSAFDIEGASFSLQGNAYVYNRVPTGRNTHRKFEMTIRNPYTSADSAPFVALGDLADISAVTSGDYERFEIVESSGLKAAHILDGSTGLPMNVAYSESTGGYSNTTGLTSVTIFDANSERADISTTIVILLGMEEGIRYMEENGLTGVLIGTALDKRYAVVGELKLSSKDDAAWREGFTPVEGYGFLPA